MNIEKDNEVKIKEVENGFIVQHTIWDDNTEDGKRLYKKEEYLIVFDDWTTVEASEIIALQNMLQNVLCCLLYSEYSVKIFKNDDKNVEYAVVREDLKKNDQVEIVNNEIYKAIESESDDS